MQWPHASGLLWRNHETKIGDLQFAPNNFNNARAAIDMSFIGAAGRKFPGILGIIEGPCSFFSGGILNERKKNSRNTL